MHLTPDLIRTIDLYADGELSPAEAAAFEALLASEETLAHRVAAIVEARDMLRAAVGRVTASTAPEALRARVESAIAAEFVEAEVAEASRLQREAGAWASAEPLRARRPAGSRMSFGAVAASLALVGGAILFGIFGPRVAERPPLAANVSVIDVAARLMSEYAMCSAEGTCSAQDQPWRSREEAQVQLTRLLNRPIVVPDLEADGFTFCSGGPSCVPGSCERGAHLLYCRLDPASDRCQWLSVFLVPVETPYMAFDPFGRAGPLQCGIDYSLVTGSGAMHYWCDGVVTWFVTPGDEIDFDEIRRAFPA
ncbi:MAG TPA: hypothetical protein PKC43_08770 [Phycisphaerales bacterium]|nr:hypothetical protein [Phycisphaerales bacterium]HMP37528.1 hypothetical protein [Phycisphaerales bacterium]